MTSYRPKVYRSNEGCCICKAKSSSSRFTDSKKYEVDSKECFKLEGEQRFGDICNACVLIVKRWKKLPKDANKNWAHVVDARTGPGVKNIFKQKKKESIPVVHENKYKYKHVYKKKSKGSLHTKRSLNVIKQSIEEEGSIPSFLDNAYWTREAICCGVIYVGQLGEVMLDQRYYNKCSSQVHRKTLAAPESMENIVKSPINIFCSKNVDTPAKEMREQMSIESIVESELASFNADSKNDTGSDFHSSDMNSSITNIHVITSDEDLDEGFCDKLDIKFEIPV